jgi:chemotaxis signal transduction protein
MPVDANRSVSDQAQNVANDARSIASSAGAAIQRQRELLVIETGGRLLGVFTEDVAGIVTGKSPAPLPRAHVSVLGVIAFRGRMFTVIDPLPLLGGPSRATQPAIVVALSGEEQLAIAADSSRGAIEISSSDIELPEQGTAPEIICGTVRRASEQISVVDVSRLFSATMQQQERRRRRF